MQYFKTLYDKSILNEAIDCQVKENIFNIKTYLPVISAKKLLIPNNVTDTIHSEKVNQFARSHGPETTDYLDYNNSTKFHVQYRILVSKLLFFSCITYIKPRHLQI